MLMITRYRDYNVDILGDIEKCYTQCSEVYQPVCGSNGQTYSSRCELEKTACQVNYKILKRNLYKSYSVKCPCLI